MLWWTLQNLVVAGLATGLIALVCRAAPIGPVGRHALWLVVLMKLVTPPLIVLELPAAMPHPRDIAKRLVAVRAPVPAVPGATPAGALPNPVAGTPSASSPRSRHR